jgi:hypothetical protein
MSRGARWSFPVLLVPVLLAGCGGSPAPAPSSPAPPSPAPTLPSVAVGGPVGLVTVGDAVWAAGASDGSVVRIDPATGTAGTPVPVGDTPLRLAADGTTLWVSVFGAEHLVAVDIRTSKVIHDVATPGGPEGVAVGFGAIWLVRQEAATLTRLDRAGKVLGTTPLGATPRLVAIGATHVWVANFGDGTLTRVRPDGSHPETSARICDGAQGLAVDRGTVWVTCTTGDEVVAVDETTMAVRGRVAVPGEPDGIRADAGGLWVVTTEGPTLVRLSADPAAPAVQRSTPLGKTTALHDRANVDLTVAGPRVLVSSVNHNKVFITPTT